MWSKNKGLSDKELYDILMQSSDDKCDKELPLEQAFSDFSSDEDLSDGEAEIHEGSLSFHELEEEEVQLPDQMEGETLRNRQSYDVDNRTWYTVAPKTGKSRSCNILQEDKGLTNRSKDVNSITDCFKLFFSENMLDIIIKYTNKKANDFIKTYNECHEDKLETWIEVDTTEMLAFLGVLILAGRFREAKESVRNLWSTTNNAFIRPLCPEIDFLTSYATFVLMICLQEPRERNKISLPRFVRLLTYLLRIAENLTNLQLLGLLMSSW